MAGADSVLRPDAAYAQDDHAIILVSVRGRRSVTGLAAAFPCAVVTGRGSGPKQGLLLEGASRPLGYRVFLFPKLALGRGQPDNGVPIYGSAAYETPRKLHRKGILGIVKHLYAQLGYNPFAWLLMATLPILPFPSTYSGSFVFFVLSWLGATLVFALTTSLISPLRCLGAGHLYLYNASFPASLLWGLLMLQGHEYVPALLLLGAVASVLGISRFYLHVKQSATLKIDSDFESALAFLSSRSKGTVMCVPPVWYDVVAYKTGLPVLYGGHGYGFKMLEETFPRLLISIGELIARFNLRYILFESGAVTEKFIADIPAHIAQDFGKYRVISIDVPE